MIKYPSVNLAQQEDMNIYHKHTHPMGCVLLCAVLHSASLILLKCCSAPLWSHNRAVKLRRAGTVAGRKLRAILYIKIKKYNKIKHLQKCYLFTLHKSDQTHQETGGYTVADQMPDCFDE